MGRANILKLLLFLVFLMLHHRSEGQWMPRAPIGTRPLCGSQFALASHACSMLPYNPVPPPSNPSTSSPTPPSPDESGHRHRHRHGHKHKRHGHHAGSPVETDCCRWLGEIDSECVCELLVHLPLFLSRPVHQYTVAVGDSCNVTYHCASRIIK